MTITLEATKSPTAPPRESLLSGRLRLPTVGIMLVVTLLAFEAMAVGTVMPVVARDLGGLALYGWGFSALLIASTLSTVVAGSWIDRSGHARPLLTGLGTFVAGLLIAGLAPEMWVLVVGRTVQGIGSGITLVGLYVMIARVYPEALRPRVLAAEATAWVVPSLVGPALGGAVAEHANWRLVFLGLIPLVIPAALMLLPALRGAAKHEPGAPVDRRRILAAVWVAAGVVLFLLAVDTAGWLLVPLAAAGMAGLGFGLRRLLPSGTLRLDRGLPAVVLVRGLMAGAFFSTDVLIALSLTSLHGFSASEAGLVLTLGALGWSVAAQFSGRSKRPRSFFVALGAVFLITGVVSAGVALQVSGWLAAPAWILGGAGMGLALSSLSVLVLDLSAEHEQGVNSSSLQLSELLGASLAVGVVGALVTAFGMDRLELGVGVGSALLAGIALVAVVGAFRVEARS